MTLHEQFVQLGKQRNQITYRLLRILPQIYEQKIHLKKGFQDIYQYAGQLAGICRSTVKKL